jgi:hypothetical protein
VPPASKTQYFQRQARLLDWIVAKITTFGEDLNSRPDGETTDDARNTE